MVAPTTPLFACSGPLSVPSVRPPFSVWLAVNVFVVYVFGIVVDAAMNELTPVVFKYPESLFHCEMLFEANELVVRLRVDVERFSVFPFHNKFIPAVILLDGVV